MQAYEHIMATMIKLSKPTDNCRGLTLEENLKLMQRYGAYFTYPDSIRALVKLSTNRAFRQPSHMSEKAWMQFITGDELKNATEYPIDKMNIPEGLELKAADGPTDLKLALKHNQSLLSTNEGKAIYEHLKQDKQTDGLFQGYLAKCYIPGIVPNTSAGEEYILYGESTKPGWASFNQTGTIVTMREFREAVAVIQQITTFELFKQLKNVYPVITFEQIRNAIFASYDNNYPEPMMNAKQYAVPSQEEQLRILYAIESKDDSYYKNLKSILLEKGAIGSIVDFDKQINDFINRVTGVDNKPITRLDTDRVI